MIKLLKNARLVADEVSGSKDEVRDILIAGGKIAAIDKKIELGNIRATEIDAGGRRVLPGLVDGHVHFIGAAGDEGYTSKTPEIFLSHFMRGGVTTAVGCLGFGRGCESVEQLYTKAQALRSEGLSAFIYSGAFRVPSPSITESTATDVAMLPWVIGVKIAIADGCSSQPTITEFARIASEAWAAGMQSGKSGVMQVHVGHHGDPFSWLFEVQKASGVPITQFIPTHCNWSKDLVEMSSAYAKKGGLVDYSTILDTARGSLTSVAASKAVMHALDSGAPISNITMSSDGNVGMPIRDEKGVQHGLYLERVSSLWHEVAALVRLGLPLEDASSIASKNPALRLGLHSKGALKPGYDADILVIGDDLKIDWVFAGGKIGLEEGVPKIFSHFEKDIVQESLTK